MSVKEVDLQVVQQAPLPQIERYYRLTGGSRCPGTCEVEKFYGFRPRCNRRQAFRRNDSYGTDTVPLYGMFSEATLAKEFPSIELLQFNLQVA